MNDYAKAREACHKFVDEFQPDLDFGPILAYPAKPMETLGLKYLKWPGKGLDDHVIYQYVEGEYMHEAEYDDFIKDPSDFMLTKWVPRTFSGLEAFSNFPTMRRMMWSGWMGLGAFASPEMQESFRIAVEAGKQINEWWESLKTLSSDPRWKASSLNCCPAMRLMIFWRPRLPMNCTP